MSKTKTCIQCGVSESKKWYKKDGGYLCQKDYRRSRYVACNEKAKEYQKQYYTSNKDKILENYHTAKDQKKTDDPRCHQRIIRDNLLQDDLIRLGKEILDTPINEYILSMESFTKEHRKFIETYEWLGTVGNSPKWTFTARCKGHLAGVVLLNEPNRYSKKLLNTDTTKMECLIQRGACASWAHMHLGSKLIKYACRWMTANTSKRIFTAYSDPRANEIGTIYQACGFDYLGLGFGAKYLYKHPVYKNKKSFTAQSLRRTSTLKKFLSMCGITWNKIWEKPNGFKDLSKLPTGYKEAWYEWINEILAESIKIKVDSKGKYISVMGSNRREQKMLNKLKIYKLYPYPKRSIDHPARPLSHLKLK